MLGAGAVISRSLPPAFNWFACAGRRRPRCPRVASRPVGRLPHGARRRRKAQDVNARSGPRRGARARLRGRCPKRPSQRQPRRHSSVHEQVSVHRLDRRRHIGPRRGFKQSRCFSLALAIGRPRRAGFSVGRLGLRHRSCGHTSRRRRCVRGFRARSASAPVLACACGRSSSGRLTRICIAVLSGRWLPPARLARVTLRVRFLGRGVALNQLGGAVPIRSRRGLLAGLRGLAASSGRRHLAISTSLPLGPELVGPGTNRISRRRLAQFLVDRPRKGAAYRRRKPLCAWAGPARQRIARTEGRRARNETRLGRNGQGVDAGHGPRASAPRRHSGRRCGLHGRSPGRRLHAPGSDR